MYGAKQNIIRLLGLITITARVSAGLDSQEQLTFNSPGFASNLQVALTSSEGMDFERISLAEFPNYAIRLRSPEKLCDTSVRQYSGYLDISDTKHLFFWFFESRDDPESDPLLLWLNGGPGCSSSSGLLFELGPCNVRDQGQSTETNPYGWNKKANLLFLDQPVNVGYSYAEGDSDAINNSVDAAKDVYAFLQLFYARFPAYLKLSFNVAAESYGGQYAPNIASRILKENQVLATTASSAAVIIPLSTVIIGNGLTDPLVQFATVPDHACAPSPYAIFDEATCDTIRSKVPTCQRLQQFCYSKPSRFTCVPATLYCWGALYGPLQRTGRNPYDVRMKCDQSTNPLCYEEISWIEDYMNRAEVRNELGVPASLEFKSCNNDVNRAFQMSGDNMHNSAQLIPELLENGVRLLIYAGEDDFMCNYIGNEKWMLQLETPFSEEFNHKTHRYLSKYPLKNTTTVERSLGEGHVGMVRSAGPGAGNYTYVSLFESGHMVPHDQPEIAYELINKWLHNQPLH